MADDELFDTRVVKRNLRNGSTSKTDLDAYLATLPDEAEEALETETRMESCLDDSAEPTAEA